MGLGKRKSRAPIGLSRRSIASVLSIGFVALSAGGWLGCGGAAAQGLSWFNFGQSGNDSPSYTTNRTDPDFVREWEANPPKGYATLAKANIEATKMAVRQYTMIVGKGGWSQIPEPPPKTPRDSLMQFGTTDPAVALLRARLAASGDLRSTNTCLLYTSPSPRDS